MDNPGGWIGVAYTLIVGLLAGYGVLWKWINDVRREQRADRDKCDARIIYLETRLETAKDNNVADRVDLEKMKTKVEIYEKRIEILETQGADERKTLLSIADGMRKLTEQNVASIAAVDRHTQNNVDNTKHLIEMLEQKGINMPGKQ